MQFAERRVSNAAQETDRFVPCWILFVVAWAKNLGWSLLAKSAVLVQSTLFAFAHVKSKTQRNLSVLLCGTASLWRAFHFQR